jgi:hypothetical protein
MMDSTKKKQIHVDKYCVDVCIKPSNKSSLYPAADESLLSKIKFITHRIRKKK